MGNTGFLRLVCHDNSSLGVGFIMELIRVFATTNRWSIAIPKDDYNGPASTSFQKP
jgi:hypothetical protein